MTSPKFWIFSSLLLVLACNNATNSTETNSPQVDSINLSVDEKMQDARRQKANQINLSSAVRYAASVNEYALWGEMIMQSKYGKPAHNFGYTVLAPPNALLSSIDMGLMQILNDPENSDLLDELIGNYLIVIPVEMTALEKFDELEFANGKKLKFDKETNKLGELELDSKSTATNNGHLIQLKNMPFFPKKELEKRYMKRKRSQS